MFGSEMRCVTSVFITQIFYINFTSLMSGFDFVNFPCFNSEVINSTRESKINGTFARVVTIWLVLVSII